MLSTAERDRLLPRSPSPKKHSRRSGGYLRRSTAHFSVRQRSPLRKRFMPSRRRSRCLAATVRSRLPRRSRSSQRRTKSASRVGTLRRVFRLAYIARDGSTVELFTAVEEGEPTFELAKWREERERLVREGGGEDIVKVLK
jgi:hypothetical protein